MARDKAAPLIIAQRLHMESCGPRDLPIVSAMRSSFTPNKSSRMRKKGLPHPASLSVISPRGGELNTSRAEGGAS